MILNLLFILSLLVVPATSNSVIDFCVADLSLPKGPAGYPCKNPANLTADNFVFTGFKEPGDTTADVFNSALKLAFDFSFPALNGLGLSMIRLDLGPNGVVPVHSHRVSEVFLLIEGAVFAGFFGPNPEGTPYYKILTKGDVMVFPHSLLHFQANIGTTNALAFTSLNSANPGIQTLPVALFGNDFPAEIMERITMIDSREIRRLKEIFGGSNGVYETV